MWPLALLVTAAVGLWAIVAHARVSGAPSGTTPAPNAPLTMELGPGDMGTIAHRMPAPSTTVTLPAGSKGLLALLSSNVNLIGGVSPGGYRPGIVSTGLYPLGVGETDLTFVWIAPDGATRQTHLHYVELPRTDLPMH